MEQVQKFDAAAGAPPKSTLKKQLTIKPPKVIKKIIKKGTQKLGVQGQGGGGSANNQEFLVNLVGDTLETIKRHGAGSNREDAGVKRSMRDFKKLASVLEKANFGCYVPHLP